MKGARVIVVKSCNPVDCPLCIPDSYNMMVNHCHFSTTHEPMKIGVVKTFPKSCPLKSKED